MLVSLLWAGLAALLIRLDLSVPIMVAILQLTVVASYLVMAVVAPGALEAAESRVATRVAIAWRGVDLTVIDAVVNGVGLVVRSWSAALRQTQAGPVRLYVAVMLGGIVAMLGYFLWR